MSTLQLHDAVMNLRGDVDDEFVQRGDNIDQVLLAMLAGQNLFWLSEPGTAKSLLWKRITMRIAEMRAFGITFNRHTPPEAVMGPQSVQALMKDQYVFKVDGFAPTAHGALFDELPRAAESTANSTLELINEGTYNQDGKKVQSELHFVVAAANSELLAEHDGLGAAWDRFTVRAVLDGVNDDGLLGLWDAEFDDNVAQPVSWPQIMEIHASLRDIKIPDDVFDGAVDLRRHMIDEYGLRMSDRKWRLSKRTIQAHAWLAQRDIAAIADLACFAYILWDKPEQAGPVERQVAKLADPYLSDVIAVADSVTVLAEDCGAWSKMTDAVEKDRASMGLATQIANLGHDIENRSAQAGGRSAAILADALRRLNTVYDTYAGPLFGTATPLPFTAYLASTRRR